MQVPKLTGPAGKGQSLAPASQIYGELCRLWQNQPYGKAPVSYDNYLQENPGLEIILNNGPCVTWILDMRTLHFTFFSKNVKEILGYDNQGFKEYGLSYFNQIVHPNDLAPTWHLVKEVWECLMALPAYQRKQHKLNINYRIIKPDGTIVKVLEQNSVLQLDDRGNVTHIISVCSDISQLERPADKITYVGKTTEQAMVLNPTNNSGTTARLSKRELEIVKLIAAGCKSRDIAAKLFISFNTVNTHRQKIIEKTNTKIPANLSSL